MANKRYVSLSDGSGMGDTLYIFETNAPVKELKLLEKISNEVYLNGGTEEDAPIWSIVLESKGYDFDYVDEHRHISAYRTSAEWIENKYPQISEHYCIENQPENFKEDYINENVYISCRK